VHHELAAGEYARRRASCEAAARALGVASLRELASLDAVAWLGLDAEQTRCVRHVVSENARTLAAAAALRAGDLSTLGRLMLESHASLRDDYRVSCAELDAIVDLASATPGVHGARMTGGGFGGCAIALATPVAAEKLLRRLAPAYAAATGGACTVERVQAAAGAGPI
jgi:galactokinase